MDLFKPNFNLSYYDHKKIIDVGHINTVQINKKKFNETKPQTPNPNP